MSELGLNEDFQDLLDVRVARGVEFVVVGAHAMAIHGVARATGDIVVLVRPSPANADRVMAALREFGAPVGVHGTSSQEFAREGWVYQIGLPPRRIDILTSISGVDFDTAWAGRCVVTVGDLSLPFLGLAELRRNKHATGRAKDVADLALLDEADRSD